MMIHIERFWRPEFLISSVIFGLLFLIIEIILTVVSWNGFIFVDYIQPSLPLPTLNFSKIFTLPPPTRDEQCFNIPLVERFDCHPDRNPSKETCLERGCCWRDINQDELPPRKKMYSEKIYTPNFDESSSPSINLPYCFYPRNYSIYSFENIQHQNEGIFADFKQVYRSPYPKDIDVLKFEVIYETCSRIRIKIHDQNNKRWQPSLPIIKSSNNECKGFELYSVQIIENTGKFSIIRKINKLPLLDNRLAAPIIFSDQYIQFSTSLTSDIVYGLGQHLNGLLLDVYWQRRVLWNSDVAPLPNTNLYGSHPFYLAMEPNGDAHGVFLLNSNAMDVDLQPTPGITFRTTGGIIDLYVFLGPTPDDVISQYTDVIGRSFLPPYWSLGYHQCRYGYGTLEYTKKIWKRTKDAGIPFDVQWNDLDYMHNQNDFTYDDNSFSALPDFVRELHNEGMHYVVITDPGVSAGETPGTYPPYDLGQMLDVFIKNESGMPFIGKVWNPKATVWPDFSKGSTLLYWFEMIKEFHKVITFDGLWIDMNEPSNFWSGQRDGCPSNSMEEPYYVPSVVGGKLYHKTICMSAQHEIGHHYNVHNLYGILEASSTHSALKMLKNGPPFIISRSSFPGLGFYSGHWTGDISSDWFNLWKSIGAIINMNIFGIPMVGADICGFGGNTTASLCNRWMQLGAFYPFSRNHNSLAAIDQDPVALGPLVVKSSRDALRQRYSMLPFLFTLFMRSHLFGTSVAKGLFMNFPEDPETYSIDTQFMWGEALLITPVLEEDSVGVTGYFPAGKWYDWYTGIKLTLFGQQYLHLKAPLDVIPLFLRGGYIIPCQNPGNTTVQSRRNSFGLTVALDSSGSAIGQMYYVPQYHEIGYSSEFNKYILFDFIVEHRNLLIVYSLAGNWDHSPKLTLGWIKIYGASEVVKSVRINGKLKNFDYSAKKQVLTINDLSLNFVRFLTVSW